jgi:RNA polymerase sigma factor (sigma-70 family)
LKNNFDKECFVRLKQNDIDAFNALYAHYHSAIYCNVLKITHNLTVTEDIVQEVFITLWEKRHTLNPGQDIAGWLFVVSYNKAVTCLKRKLKECLIKTTVEQTDDYTLDDTNDLVDAQINMLEQAIQQLSPQKRKVFELCKLQHKTYEEAAKELMISKHTVKEYLACAILSIKDYIKQHPEYALTVISGIIFKHFLS